jgi:ABC-type nitrate/sulfonate/bicarbonate transport system ATPase subunit
MAQRVSIARAFATQPRILLLDEPFSNMDAALKGSLTAVFQEMIMEGAVTVVLVTHDLTEALQLADRIVELTPDHRLRELDLSDRTALAEEWLSAKIQPRS